MGSMGVAIFAALCLLQMSPVEAGFAIRFYSDAGGAYHEQTGWYLTAQRYYAADRRSGDSTYLSIDGSQKAEDYIWEFEPAGTGPNRYHIKFVSETDGQSGWYLTAQRYLGTDERSGRSTFVSIDGGFQVSQNMYVWELEPSAAPGRYKIKFVSEEYDQQGWYLTAQSYYPADRRNSQSTYAEIDGSVGGSEWEVFPVGTAQAALVESIPRNESTTGEAFVVLP